MSDAPPSYEESLGAQGFVPVDHVPTASVYTLPPVQPPPYSSLGSHQTNSISVQPAGRTEISRQVVPPIVPASPAAARARPAPRPAPKPAPARNTQTAFIKDPLRPDQVTPDEKRNVLIAKIYRLYIGQFVLYGGLCALACYVHGVRNFYLSPEAKIPLYVSIGLLVVQLIISFQFRKPQHNCQNKTNNCPKGNFIFLSLALGMLLMSLAGLYDAPGMIVGCLGIVVVLCISHAAHMKKGGMTEKHNYIKSLILSIVASGICVGITYSIINPTLDMRYVWPQLLPAPIMILVFIMSTAISSNRAIQVLQKRDIEEHLVTYLAYLTEIDLLLGVFIVIVNFVTFVKTLQGECRPMNRVQAR